MIKPSTKLQEGFTTVELMITLAIAALLIIAGYQLYGAVNLRSSNTRQMAEASNIGYEVLRSDGSNYVTTSTICSSGSSEVSVTRPSPANIKNMQILLQRCRPHADSNIIRVTVIVKYGETGPNREVRHATYLSS